MPAEATAGKVIPTSLDEVLSSILEFSDEQFDILVQSVRGPDGLSGDKERCEKLAAEIGVAPAAVGYLLGALNYVYSALPGATEKGGSRAAGLANVLNDIDFEAETASIEKIKARLSLVLLENTNLAKYKKMVKLREGFIRSAVSFSSFVDLRPNFNEERTEILSVIPVIQFRIRTNSDVETEKNVVFQMDRKAVRRLKEAVDYVTRKLDAIDASDFLVNKIDEFDRS